MPLNRIAGVAVLTGLGLLPVAPQAQQPPPAATQTGTGLIVGTVIDAGSGRPVAGAIVSINGGTPPAPAPVGRGGAPGVAPPARIVTDVEGHFAFRNLARGSFTVNASRPDTSTARTGGSVRRARPARSISATASGAPT
jgi:protocatechuate 3,4-dioxygenase beta subunit